MVGRDIYQLSCSQLGGWASFEGRDITIWAFGHELSFSRGIFICAQSRSQLKKKFNKFVPFIEFLTFVVEDFDFSLKILVCTTSISTPQIAKGPLRHTSHGSHRKDDYYSA